MNIYHPSKTTFIRSAEKKGDYFDDKVIQVNLLKAKRRTFINKTRLSPITLKNPRQQTISKYLEYTNKKPEQKVETIDSGFIDSLNDSTVSITSFQKQGDEIICRMKIKTREEPQEETQEEPELKEESEPQEETQEEPELKEESEPQEETQEEPESKE